ncbi:Malonyl-[acyl-carrier protein] O-methyltransferase [Nymphon striatum]|nr:Malonyl-[acyl-carrier protein] O-methyltransferase [Nymphon striatum]
MLKRYPKAQVTALALSMVKKSKQQGSWFRKPKAVCADAEKLPFKSESMDLIISSLMLQWSNNLTETFSGFHSTLAPNGLLLFASFGPDTLKEIKQSWSAVDNTPHTSEFADMHEIGDALLQSGFIDPVTDMETITMTYANVRQVMRDIKKIGATNSHSDRQKGLMGKDKLKAFEAAYEQLTPDGLYPATWEIVYGHAWVGEGVKTKVFRGSVNIMWLKQKKLVSLISVLTIAGALNIAPVNAASAISNGTISLGVNDEGNLIVGGVGLTFGKAGEDFGDQNITIESFTSTATTATSIVRVVDGSGNLVRVTHDFLPSTSANLYQVDVTIENISGATIPDLRYRRAMDWDTPPTEFTELVTIVTGGATDLLFSSDDGFADGNPLSGPSSILFTGEATNSGPADHGALFDFGFGVVTADNIYSLGKPDPANAAVGVDGSPNTFIFGFKGVGAPPVVPPVAPIPTLSTYGIALLTMMLSGLGYFNLDYKQWPTWSPWLIMERDTELTYNEKQGQVGANYDWKGELVGQGGMELLNQDGASPQTKVTWKMFSKLPFFLFFMVTKMKVLIGMDYDRGLRMLKEYIEDKKVSSAVSIDGINTIESQKYIGFKRHQKGLANDVVPFSIYNIFDIFNGEVEYIAAFPVTSHINASDIEPPYFIGKLDQQEALKITHTGKYDHLGNAWSTAMNYSRHKKIKMRKTPVGIEFYLNDPMTTSPEELVTEVMLPLK